MLIATKHVRRPYGGKEEGVHVMGMSDAWNWNRASWVACEEEAPMGTKVRRGRIPPSLLENDPASFLTCAFAIVSKSREWHASTFAQAPWIGIDAVSRDMHEIRKLAMSDGPASSEASQRMSPTAQQTRNNACAGICRSKSFPFVI